MNRVNTKGYTIFFIIRHCTAAAVHTQNFGQLWQQYSMGSAKCKILSISLYWFFFCQVLTSMGWIDLGLIINIYKYLNSYNCEILGVRVNLRTHGNKWSIYSIAVHSGRVLHNDVVKMFLDGKGLMCPKVWVANEV